MDVMMLQFGDGDVLVLQGYHHDSEIGHAFLQSLLDMVDRSGKKNVTVVCLSRGTTLEALDEARMNECGWYRRREDFL